MPEDRRGEQLGNYRLIQLLGEGGFAQVYLGEHVFLKKSAAIKVLHGHVTEDALETFLKEAKIIARLEHPHIVQVIDFGVETTIPFLVMNYAPNGTLRQRHCEGSRLPLSTIVSYLKQIAPALQYAHTLKVIHRDIKPQNILIGLQDELLLSDFGIAVVFESSSFQSTQNQAGTSAYMAPEQIQGHPRPASDQYSLGVVVYEWICGERPFQGTSREIEVHHQFAPPPPLRGKAPHVSPAMEHVVHRALAKDPNERFATVQDFADAFEQACQLPASALIKTPLTASLRIDTSPNTVTMRQQPGPPISALNSNHIPLSPITTRVANVQPNISVSIASSDNISKPPSIINPCYESISHHISQAATPPPPQPVPSSSGKGFFTRKSLFLIGLTFLVAIGSVSFLYISMFNSNAQFEATATAQAQATFTAKTNETMFAATAQAQVNATTTALAQARVTATPQATTTDNGVMFGFDAAHTHFNPDEHVLSPTNVSGLVPDWTAHTEDNILSSPTVANGLVYIGSGHRLFAFNANTGVERWASFTNVIFYSSPAVVNGLVYIGSWDGKLYAFNANTGELQWNSSTGSHIWSSPTVINGRVYVGSQAGKLYAFDAKTGALQWTASTDSAIFYSSPAVVNGFVYVGTYAGKLYAFDAATGIRKWASLAGSHISSSPAVANGLVFVGSIDAQLYAFDAMTGTLKWVTRTGASIHSSPAVANGLVYVGSDDHRLYAFDAFTGEPKWASSTGASIHSSPAVANGVVYVGSDDHKLYAFDAATSKVLWSVSTGDVIFSSPAVANDVVYVGSKDDKLYAFHLPGTTP